jgi:hypothetical protein
MNKKPVKVTVSDPDNGAVLEETVLDNNWTVICAGNRYVKSMQQMGSTVMLSIAVVKPDGERA